MWAMCIQQADNHSTPSKGYLSQISPTEYDDHLGPSDKSHYQALHQL